MDEEIGFDRILLPTDGSEASKKAARKAAHLSKSLNIPILAYHVLNTPQVSHASVSEVYPDFTEILKKEADSIIENINKIAKEIGVTVESKIVEGYPDREIIKEANENDLIIMGSKGKSNLDRILIGSISEKVLHHSNSTVMIVR
ncbi:MAG: universal stress protein [Candidatus Thermoplasmatota archaeon]